jgi:hypothetical protein
MAYFITCPWCLSIYFGTMSAVAFVALYRMNWWLIIPAALAFSYTAGLLARIEQD